MAAMEAEHCSKAGSAWEFTTSNYGITTKPQTEWRIVIGEMKCPDHQCGFGRRYQSVDSLLAIRPANDAKLIRVEVIAVVLYTGPMVRKVGFLEFEYIAKV